jgi:predicted phage terminase large subunit-like protein
MMDIAGMSQEEIKALQSILSPKMSKYVPLTPTPKQTAFLLMNDVREVLYGGAAGGGKSIAQMMAALQYVDVPGYSAILFRKTYADLALPGALLSISKDWLMPYVDSKEVHWADKDKKYTFPSGATLSFGYLESENDCYRYQGAEFQYVGFDECTHISPSNYRYLHSRLRKPKNLPVPLRFRATANPGGVFGEYYYQRFFVDKKERIFIGAGIKDNPHLDAEEYIKSLDELDPVTREQLLNGNWEIKEAGNMFSKEWFFTTPRHNVPTGTRAIRYWDMASTDPTKRKKGADKRAPDWTVGLKLLEKQGMFWIDDIVRVQKSPHEVEQIIAATAAADGYGCAIRMEQEPGSSGEITIDHYSRNILSGYNFGGVRSTGSKTERAAPVSAASQAGRVLIVEDCRNITAALDEFEVFPYGPKDDIVDAFSGAYTYFRNPVVLSSPRSLRKGAGSYWSKIERGVGSTYGYQL